MAWRPQFNVDIEPLAIGLVLASSVVMALLAALVPARAVAGLEPVEVFRG
jgi:ABC-type lipoprotein release transport system permease subunit